VDVYAVTGTVEDPTHFGRGALAYGCCGVFARDQRTWPDSDDMLTEANVQRIRSTERALLSDPDVKRRCYQLMRLERGAQVGRVDPAQDLDAVQCVRPVSITGFFWPSVTEGPAGLVDCEELHGAGLYCELLDDAGNILAVGENYNDTSSGIDASQLVARIYTPDGNGTQMRPASVVRSYLADLAARNLLDPTYRLLLDRKFGEGGRQSSRGLISRFVFEQPSEVAASEEEQEVWMEDFSAYLADKLLVSLNSLADQSDSIDFLAYSASFLDVWRREGVENSVAWSAGALVAVYVLLWIRMRSAVAGARHAGPAKRFFMSFVLPTGAMLHVLEGFPVAWAVYRFIYQQRYIGYMQFLSVFLALGIGVDDVFLMFDAWTQSKDEGVAPEDLEGRMRFAWCRAARAMFITSVTDGLAFLANSFSIIAAVRLFGYLMATIVTVNYVLDVTLFPALLALVERWATQGRSGNARGLQPEPTVVGAADSDILEAEDEKRTTGPLRQRTNRLESFMQDTYSTVLYRGRWILLIAWVLVTAAFAAGLSQLRRSDRAFRFETFPDWFPLSRLYNMGLPEEPGDIFGDATPVQPIYVLLGTRGLDRSGGDGSNPLELGTPMLSPSFDLAQPAQQEGALRLCRRLAQLSTTREQQVLCPLRHFRQWHLRASSSSRWPEPNATLLMEHLSFFANVPERLTACRGNRNGNGAYELNDDGGRACRLWHRTGGADRAGLFYRALERQEYPNFFGFDPVVGRVSWMVAAVVNSTLSPQSPAAAGRPVYDEIQGALAAAEAAGETAGLGVQAAALWPQMVTEEAMVTAAWQGILASLGVAAVTLLVFTRSPMLSVMCILSVASIVTITMGIMPALGWRMGFLEAMCTVFVVGFSVDFSAHCAVAFQESAQEQRRTKVAEAIGVLGASLFWGMITTVAAAVFLLFCVMVPFSKMGVFLMWNQFVSFGVAVCFFAAALMVAGPLGRGRERARADPDRTEESGRVPTDVALADGREASVEGARPGRVEGSGGAEEEEAAQSGRTAANHARVALGAAPGCQSRRPGAEEGAAGRKVSL